MSVIKSICDDIAHKDNLHDQILRAAYCFESYHGMSSDAWDEDIKNIKPVEEDISQLKSVLEEFIINNPNSDSVGSAIWAFGKISGAEDKELLIDLLKKYLDKDPQILYQVMCAIDNIGEKIFNKKSSLIDFEQNISQAKQYLRLN